MIRIQILSLVVPKALEVLSREKPIILLPQPVLCEVILRGFLPGRWAIESRPFIF